MARLLVVYDPKGRVVPDPCLAAAGIKHALLDTVDDVTNLQIYDLAKQLAYMLLEQIRQARP